MKLISDLAAHALRQQTALAQLRCGEQSSDLFRMDLAKKVFDSWVSYANHDTDKDFCLRGYPVYASFIQAIGGIGSFRSLSRDQKVELLHRFVEEADFIVKTLQECGSSVSSFKLDEGVAGLMIDLYEFEEDCFDKLEKGEALPDGMCSNVEVDGQTQSKLNTVVLLKFSNPNYLPEFFD